MSKGFRVAVVGATGLVGREMMATLEQRKFPVREIVAIASPRSAGLEVSFAGAPVRVRSADEADVFEGVEIALFSAGGAVSRELGPRAARAGAIVIDNSSAFRMDPDVPLCVPEVNLESARNPIKGIIANPNCSTIQLVVALKPLHDAVRLIRVIVDTYQSISGAGARAVQRFDEDRAADVRGEAAADVHGLLSGNVLMHWKPDPATGYSEEELKIIRETKKILDDDQIRISATSVRVPVIRSHSEAVTLSGERSLDAAEARALLEAAKGVTVIDDFEAGIYPTPREAAHRDSVYVGRIRNDLGQPGGIQLWIVSDNLRKGAALNAVQIAEGLFL